MRKGFGIGLTVLGGFLVALAVLAQFWAPGQVKKTPLDTDSTTRLDGTADKLNRGDRRGRDAFHVKATSITKADSERSDDDVVVFVKLHLPRHRRGRRRPTASRRRPGGAPRHRVAPTSSPPTARPRWPSTTRSTSRRAPRRRRAWSTSGPSTPRRRTTPTGTACSAQAVDAVYDGTETIDGLETYKYHVLVDDAPAEVVDGIAGHLLRRTSTSGSTRPPARSSTRPSTSCARSRTATRCSTCDLAFTDEQVDGQRRRRQGQRPARSTCSPRPCR